MEMLHYAMNFQECSLLGSHHETMENDKVFKSLAEPGNCEYFHASTKTG